MKRSDNTILYGILAALVTFCAIGLGWQEYTQSWLQSVPQDFGESRYAADAQAALATICSGLTGSDLTTCQSAILQTAQDDHRDQLDLLAQSKMAIWAFWMLIATGFATAITAIGLYLIYETLQQTAETNAAALAAADAGKKANEIMLMNTRPWLKVELQLDGPWESILPKPNARINCTLRIDNLGQTVATGVVIKYSAHSGRKGIIQNTVDSLIERATSPEEGKSNLIIFPGQPFEHPLIIPITQADIYDVERIDDKTMVTFPDLCAVVSYHSQGSHKPHLTPVAYSLSQDSNGFYVDEDCPMANDKIALRRLALEQSPD